MPPGDRSIIREAVVTKRLLFVGVPLLLLVLAVAWSGLLREVFVLPLLNAFWIAYLAIGSLPQWLIWGAFVLIAAIAAIRSLSLVPPKPLPGKPASFASGPVEVWSRTIVAASDSEVAQQRLAAHLRQLAIEALGHDHGLLPHEVMQRLQAGTLAVPLDVRQYLLAGVKRSESHLQPGRQPWAFWWNAQPAPVTEPDRGPERVVDFLEARLNQTIEAEHDSGTH